MPPPPPALPRVEEPPWHRQLRWEPACARLHFGVSLGTFLFTHNPFGHFLELGGIPRLCAASRGCFWRIWSPCKCHWVPHGPWDAAPEPSGSSPGALAQLLRSASPNLWLQKVLTPPSKGHSVAHRNSHQILFHRGTGRSGGDLRRSRCHPKALTSPRPPNWSQAERLLPNLLQVLKCKAPWVERPQGPCPRPCPHLLTALGKSQLAKLLLLGLL